MSTPSGSALGERFPEHGDRWGRRSGEHLEAARHRARLDRRDVAERLGVHEETVRRWEVGGSRPSDDHLAVLVTLFSIEGGWSRFDAHDPDVPPLARRIRAERKERGLTQAQAAETLGVSQSTLAGWELGRSRPTGPSRNQVASFLGLDRRQLQLVEAQHFAVDISGFPPLGRFIGGRRELLRLTRAALAAELRVSIPTIAAWERGYRRPRPHQVRPLAAALRCSPDLIAEIVNPPLNAPSTLGRLIRSRQATLGLRAADVANRAGVNKSTISRWARGRNLPDNTSRRRLAAALELSDQQLEEFTPGA